MKKQRLDQALLESGLAESRERARAAIMAGLVFVDGRRTDKPGTAVKTESVIELRGEAMPYVSRGGLKLEKALRVFSCEVSGKLCVDCGASTGGFTDVLLRAGAARVYAVDVGYGQLAWRLRNDPRVVTLERTNVRYISREQIPETLDLAVMDLSFISLRLALPAVSAFLGDEGEAVCLVKPQFEAGREKVGKKGVVRDPAVHLEVLESFAQYAAAAGYTLQNVDYSPIRGPEGNIEYLAYLKKGHFPADAPDLAAVVRASHDAADERKQEHE